MILKKFSAPTLEAAKAEAKEVYGEDFVLLESDPSSLNGDAQITVIVDQRKETSVAGNHRHEEPLVVIRPTPVQGASPGRRRSPLESVRLFARAQENGNMESRDPEPVVTTSYNRSMARPGSPGLRTSLRKNGHKAGQPLSSDTPEPSKPEVDPNPEPRDSLTQELVGDRPRSNPLVQSDRPRQNPVREDRQHRRELEAVHYRFDQIESILNSSILAANLEYLAHPSFQQLVKVGVHPTVISGWFSSILQKGIDPYNNGRTFMHELATILRTTLSRQSETPTRPFLLFTGPSGGGKTALIQKLALHPDFMGKQSVAVVSVMTTGDTPYYTVLNPFCRDCDIPYYEVTPEENLASYKEEWSTYDHVLIDTPSLQVQQPESFRGFRDQRKWLSECGPMEVHYVVNAASQSLYFQGETPSSHPVRPDYLDITHLDEVVKWGHLIPMFQKLEIPTRYVTAGVDIPESLMRFDPAWFTRQLLKKESTI
ncbi:MAG: hypothetical protein WEA36_10500 [Balneolaceae bacterium]